MYSSKINLIYDHFNTSEAIQKLKSSVIIAFYSIYYFKIFGMKSIHEPVMPQFLEQLKQCYL